MSEHRSRLNSCNTTRGWDLDFYRWVERMERPFLKREQWRTSSQVGRRRRRRRRNWLLGCRLDIVRSSCGALPYRSRLFDCVCCPCLFGACSGLC